VLLKALFSLLEVMLLSISLLTLSGLSLGFVLVEPFRLVLELLGFGLGLGFLVELLLEERLVAEKRTRGENRVGENRVLTEETTLPPSVLMIVLIFGGFDGVGGVGIRVWVWVRVRVWGVSFSLVSETEFDFRDILFASGSSLNSSSLGLELGLELE
jgi:hypothetical protein